MEDVREQEVKKRSRFIEEATLPTQTQIDELKRDVNDSLEAMSEKVLQLEGQIDTRNGVLSEQELLKVVGYILGNEKLIAFLADKIRDKIKDKPIKVSFDIG